MAKRSQNRSGRRSSQHPSEAAPVPEKTCASCGRRMQWRAKWASSWDEVKYCSDACRRRGVTVVDAQLEATILRLLGARPSHGSITASDAAVAVGGELSRDLAEHARRAARRLVAKGVVEIVQNGRVVDPSTARGPIAIRLSGA